MLVPHSPKSNKNVLLVSTAHREPHLCEQADKKPIAIDFNNTQQCGLDIASQMLRDYSCQPTCDC